MLCILICNFAFCILILYSFLLFASNQPIAYNARQWSVSCRTLSSVRSTKFHIRKNCAGKFQEHSDNKTQLAGRHRPGAARSYRPAQEFSRFENKLVGSTRIRRTAGQSPSLRRDNFFRPQVSGQSVVPSRSARRPRFAHPAASKRSI